MNRRDFLTLTAASTAALSLPALTQGQGGRAPAQAKDDELKITDIKCFNTGRLIVRVSTSEASIVGYGEYNAGPAGIAEAIINTYKPLLIGANPTRIEYLWQTLFRAHRNMRGGNALIPVFAAIDMALWDILGKFTKLPVYALLGGAVRDKILFYPNAKAHKQTTGLMHNMVETPARLDGWVKALEDTRAKLGPSGYLMVDGHGKLSATAAIQLCKRIEHLGVLYFEEVVPPENNADLAKVKAATSVPLAVGERMTTIFPFREIFEARSCDVINADVCTIGGISQLKKLAGIAEMFNIALAPHGNHSLLGLAASLHVDASIHNFLIQEDYPNKDAAFSVDWLPKDSQWPTGEYMPLPTGPGLGVNVSDEALAEAAAKRAEKGEATINKAYFREDGSPGDR